jgi:hypothetical protein
MSDVQQARGGFLGFLTTIPGILTAVAAIITATGGVYVASNHGNSSPVPVNLIMPPNGSVPTTTTSIDPDSLRLSGASADVSTLGSKDPVQDLLDQCAAGDAVSCASILDTLARECEDGAGISCDVLYELSPAGSDYEAYGASCGYRWPYDDYADRCGEQ